MMKEWFPRYQLWRGMLLRGKGRSIPLPYGVWINRPQGLTAKAVRMEVKSYPHSMTYNRLDREGNAGHSSTTTGGNSGRRKKEKWLARPFSAKMIPFRQKKFGKESLVWGQKLADKDTGLQPKLRVVPRPQKESLVLDRHWQKRDAKSANSEDVTRL